jgi:hypothetical protein
MSGRVTWLTVERVDSLSRRPSVVFVTGRLEGEPLQIGDSVTNGHVIFVPAGSSGDTDLQRRLCPLRDVHGTAVDLSLAGMDDLPTARPERRADSWGGRTCHVPCGRPGSA